MNRGFHAQILSEILAYFRNLIVVSGRFLTFCFYAVIFLLVCAVLMIGIAKITGHTGSIKTYDKDGNLIKEQRY